MNVLHASFGDVPSTFVSLSQFFVVFVSVLYFFYFLKLLAFSVDLGAFVKEEGDSEEFSKEEGEDFEGEMEEAVHPNQDTEDDNEEEEMRMGEAASELECPCDGCDEKFSSAEPLREHMLKHPKTLACKVCKKQFKKPCFLRNHFPVHKSKLDCPMCRKKKTFWGRAQLEAHIRLRHNNTFSRCEDCGKNLCSLQSLRAHQRVHQSQRRVNSCDNCRRGFGSYGGFRRHKCVRYVDIQRTFACSICSYQTSSPSSLAIHERRHNEEKTFACNECDYKAFTSTTLNKHKLRKHK